MVVWVYDAPLKKSELELKNELNKGLKQKSEKVVKLLSLLNFLHKHKFQSAEKLKASAFYDAKHTRPIFSEEQADMLVGRTKGGALKGKNPLSSKPPADKMAVEATKSNYPLTEYIINKAASTAARLDPTPISPTIRTAFGFIKSPIKFVENTPFGPVVEIGLGFFHTASEIGVSVLNSVGPAIGGPVGMAIVLPVSLFIAVLSSALAVAEGDLGQAVVHVINALPVVGQPLTKFMSKGESMNRRVQRMSKRVAKIPMVGPIIAPLIPKIGGKRFSTRRYINSKWATQRRRSANL